LDKKVLTVTVHAECGNCGATLMGPYCFDCGQHRHESARSVSALFEDAWHVATHVDGRFWQTLYILLFYAQGRLLTFAKLCVVSFTYLIGFSLTVAATGLLSVIIA
jgi:hypothetical protein